MTDALLVVLSMTLGIALPALLIRYDLRRLDSTRLTRAWPDTSFWVAVVVFGPLCIPVHFWKTRRSVLGLALGLLWCLAEIFAISALTALAGGVLE